MSSTIIKLNIGQFLLIYLLLIVVLIIMKRSHVERTKLLLVASFRMTVQLIIAGFILTWIFKNPDPIFTVIYLLAMICFAVYRIITREPWLNKKFKLYIVLAITFSGLFVLAYFIIAVINTSLFNPQYAIPIGGMVIGNAMTGVCLGLDNNFPL